MVAQDFCSYCLLMERDGSMARKEEVRVKLGLFISKFEYK